MSEESVGTDTLENKPVEGLEKLTSLFNEEIYVRVDAGSVPASKFKIYDDLIEYFKTMGKVSEAKSRLEEHFKEHPESISARYMLGMISLIEEQIDEASLLKMLLDQFRTHGKWGIIEHITENILQFGDERMPLRFKAEALEKLKKNKELKLVLEKLVKHDRKNPEFAKKYALSILEENKPKAIDALKQAAEAFARSKDFNQLDEIWPILVANNFEDIQFIEKIERILLGHREKLRLVGYLYPFIDPFKETEDWDKEIYILKKILDHEPLSQKARNELIRAFKAKYSGHSLLEDFLKMSEIGNNKKPVNQCVANFERNIVFDTNNYVMHRSWGVGKITSISGNGDSIFVDFADKKEHKLSIQMAITSLKPLKKDHIWVEYYENQSAIEELIKNDVNSFLVKLLTSFDNKMTISEIKHELVGTFVKATDWSKWWNKAKIALKKEPKIGFNPKKKDEVLFRSKPITLAEELSEKFNALTDVNKKLDIAMEALKDASETEEAIDLFSHFYLEEEKCGDPKRAIVAYLYIEEVIKEQGSEVVTGHIKSEIGSIVQSLSAKELVQYSSSLTNIELKKSLIQLIKDHRPGDCLDIMQGILYEVPVKINKHVFSLLVAEKKFNELNNFLDFVISKYKEHPEVFLWVAKSILTGAWNYEWMKVSRIALILQVFRLLKPLAKLEPKGMKLKNAAIDLIFGHENAVLNMAVEQGDDEYIRKLYAQFREVPYITDIEKEKLYEMINTLKPGMKWSDEDTTEDEGEEDVTAFIPAGVILVTRKSFNLHKDEFNHLVNVDMAENSRDIGEAQEKGDLRENAEYKAAMEKQAQLQAASKRMEAELKSAQILDFASVKTDRVNIGCSVKMRNTSSNETLVYTILGAWDADTEKNIISYQSPLAKALLGKKTGDEAKLDFEGTKTNFEILEISKFSYTD